MQRLLEVLEKLRAPDGCPWDRKQTHLSLRKYLLEEAAEAVDAISAGEPEEMADELGDVLLQVAFHAVIAREEGTFDYDDIEEAIVAKLIRRHPHVFGTVDVEDADEVVSNWNAIKEAEKADRNRGSRGGSGASRGADSAADRAASVPRSLPALMRAAEVTKAAGWDPPTAAPALPGSSEREIGDHLLAVAHYARVNGVDPEIALREAIDRSLEASDVE